MFSICNLVLGLTLVLGFSSLQLLTSLDLVVIVYDVLTIGSLDLVILAETSVRKPSQHFERAD